MIKFLKNKIGNDLNTFSDVRNGSLNNLDKFLIILTVVLCALLYIPLLGNFFMIDPWENHYSHVAWETLDKNSFAKLWFQNSNKFWSKPPLLFWMLMPFYKFNISEFSGRLPIALFSILSLVGFYILLTRLISRKSAIISTFVLMLSPQYFMLSRQIMVDLPFVALNTIAMLCMAVYYFGNMSVDEKIFKKIPRRDFYLYLFYFFEGWAFLAKGLLSILIPGIALFIFMVFTRNFSWFFAWRHLKKHLIGMVVYLAVVMPWFGYMWISEGKSFFDTFIIYHHFKRTTGEIHKPNDLYTLYVRILGYALFPWSAFLPAALYNFLTKKEEDYEKIKKLFFFSSFIGPFLFFSFSSTKFYHYIAPVVPFLAIFSGIYIEKLWGERWTLAAKVEALIAIFLVAAIGRDIGDKHTLFLHLVTFYNTRKVPVPASWEPVIISVFAVFCFIIFLMILNRNLQKKGFYILFALSAGFMTYYFAEPLPEISKYYSLKPHVEAYLKDSPERAPIADYYKWLRKSAGFWLKNEITFLQTDKEKNVIRFFDKPGVQYVILRENDKKRFESLMKRINKRTVTVYSGAKNMLLKVYGKGHEHDISKASGYIVQNLPENLIKTNIVFDNVIKLEGFVIDRNNITERDGKFYAKEGTTINVELYFRSIADKINKDYDVFLHNEGNNKDKRTKGDGNMANGTYPTDLWKKGDLVRHPLKIKIPENSQNNYYISYTGLYQEEYRANITNKEEIKNENDNRAELLRIYLDR
ncbi:glycosyltransferase family 39 protein [bacterium]|nr:glycosyltransferase family 39 protein [bacterium]